MVMLYIAGIVTIVKGYQSPVSRSWNHCHQKKFFCELKDSEQKKCDSDSDGNLSCRYKKKNYN